jgi:hypothetical protein
MKPKASQRIVIAAAMTAHERKATGPKAFTAEAVVKNRRSRLTSGTIVPKNEWAPA